MTEAQKPNTERKEFLDFIEFFNSLKIEERYPLSKAFNLATGGKLSPHNNPIAVAVAIVQIEDEDGSIKLLGLKRGIPPFVGGVAFPGGFTEQLESANMAAARELKEELGLELSGNDFEVFGNPLMSPQNNELWFFKYKHVLPKSVLNELKLSAEALEFVLIDENTEMCFPHHKTKANQIFELLNPKSNLKVKL
jgi:ADP-ribose pyrophosphatase YjhB (NUDIX family)